MQSKAIAVVVTAVVAVVVAVGAIVLRPGPTPPPAPRLAQPAAEPAVASVVPTPTVAPRVTPIPVEWPQLRSLDELVHRAHELSLKHDHDGMRAMVPDLAKASKVLLTATVPALPGADDAWMKRRIATLQQNLQILDAAAHLPEGTDDHKATEELHEAINSVIDNVEVMMGATAAQHKGIIRSEHAHADHNCGA